MSIPFRPFQGTEEIINKQDSYPGHVYFATDSGKIFLDTQSGERIVVGGGGVSVLYASAQEVKEDLTDFSYLMYKDADLDDEDATPKKDDLIINSDGRFFKVLSFNKESGLIKCSLIAVSGTGGGGGGGNTGGGTDTSGPYVTLKSTGTAPNAQVYIYGQAQNIEFTATATDDTVLTITYTITSATNADLSETYTSTVYSGQADVFDLGSKLYRGSNTLMVTAVGSNSGSYTLRYNAINSIVLALKESNNFNPLNYAYDDDLVFYSIPVGEVNKTLKVYLNNDEAASKTYPATVTEETQGITIPKRDHGVYSLKAVLSYSTGVSEIQTDPLKYEVAFVDSNETAPLIWFKTYPETITDHDKLSLQFMVYDPVNKSTTVQRYINGEEITELEEIANSKTDWITWNISNYVVGKNTFALKCGTTTREIVIYVEPDTVRNLELVTAGLYLNLDTLDRSNKENKTSRETWEYKHSNGTTTAVKFNNFNWYNNGWIDDSEINNSVLRISNGASIEIPLSIMNTTSLSDSLTFEIRFKLRNVQEYENLIKYTAILDDEGEVESVKKEVISEKGVWAKYYNKGIGMCLGTQEGFFKGAANISAGRYKEDQIVTVSFVIQSPSEGGTYPLIAMYIDGIMSSISTYTSNESFASQASAIIINSDYCDVDLYNIRVYKAGLASNEIVQNYLADRNDADLYDMNQVISFKNGLPTVDYNLMCAYNQNHPDKPLQPYAVVKRADGSADDDLLPYKKGNKKKLDVKFVNPALDRAYALGNIDDATYLCGAPSFNATSIEFDVQGTSSQGYPRRNFKGKFKKGTSWIYANGPLKDQSLNDKITFGDKKYKGFYMDNTFSETTFTWKADYMESSMTHNTGYASFVNTLYDYHPLEKYDSDIDVTNRRTTIYGFPMLLFQEKYEKDEDGQPIYEFIGRYNFNLDKGCNNVIGFNEEKEHPIIKGTYINDDGEEVPIDYAYVAECWELKNNQGTRTSFLYTNFDEVDDKGNLALHGDFEYRYSYFEDPIDHAIDGTDEFASSSQAERNAYLLERFSNLEVMAEWLKSTDTTAVISQAEHEDTSNELTATVLGAPVTYGTGDLAVTYTHDTKEYRLAKFSNEFTLHFDMHYCAVYFIMTEMVLAYDSRGKNMMLASWGPQDYRKDSTGQYILDEAGEKIPADYIWFPIFYDIDTQLGVNNSGVPSWEYYEEATKNGTFSTSSSVLWVNFYSCFKSTIENEYAKLRNGNLNYDSLYGYYSYNPTFISYTGVDGKIHNSYAMQGNRPMNVINIDEYYKYISPTISGYINTEGKTAYDYGKRFYCLQGNRDLHRNLFLRNRFNFMDSLWQGGVYDPEGITQQIKVRVNANLLASTSDKWLNRALTEEEIAAGFVQAPYKENALDADWTWDITPYLRQYVSIRFDEKLERAPVLYNGDGNPVAVRVSDSNEQAVQTVPNHTQQIFYIGGADYVSSLGDLSCKYLDEMEFEKMRRLKDLHLGSDIEDYRNAIQIKTFQLGAGKLNSEKKENEYAKTLLESVVLTGVTALDADLDISGSEKLKEFRALNTNLAGVSFADGVQLETLYLPKSVTYFDLVEPVSLSGILTENAPTTDDEGNIVIDDNGYYVFPKGIFLEGVTDNTEDKTKIRKYSITGGQMGYDSYKILKRLVEIKQGMQDMDDLSTDYDKSIAVTLKEVDWTPYRLVAYGEDYLAGTRYKKITDNSTLEDYIPDSANWSTDTLNQLIYEVNENREKEMSVINDLSMLDLFLDETENLASSETNFFKDTIENDDGSPTYPNITGNMYIYNTDTAISEYKLKNHYNVKYPKLNILVNKVTPAYTLKMVEVDADTGQEIVLETLKYEQVEGGLAVNPSDITVKPSRLHHDFIGWTATKGSTNILTDEQWAEMIFNEDNTIYTVYAVFVITSYKAHFKDITSGYYEIVEAEYGTNFDIPNLIPSRDEQEAQMDLKDRIAFRGWTNNADLSNYVVSEGELNSLMVDPTTYISEKDYTFFALFVVEDALITPTSDEYFLFEEITSTTFKISGNPKYQLSGKITLPITHTLSNGEQGYITHIGDFVNALHTKHIFFLQGGQYSHIMANAFYNSTDGVETSLEGVYLPDTIRYIGNNAFRGCTSIKHVSDKFVHEGISGYLNDEIYYIGDGAFQGTLSTNAQFMINELPSALTTLGEGAFYSGGDNIFFTKLPPNLAAIPTQAFGFCKNISFSEFGSKNSDAVNTPLKSIGSGAFIQDAYSNSGAHRSVERISIWDSVDTIGSQAFVGYGYETVAGEEDEFGMSIMLSNVDVYTNSMNGKWISNFIDAGLANFPQLSE